MPIKANNNGLVSCRLYLESEPDKDWPAIMHLRLYFCNFVYKLITSVSSKLIISKCLCTKMVIFVHRVLKYVVVFNDIFFVCNTLHFLLQLVLTKHSLYFYVDRVSSRVFASKGSQMQFVFPV